MDLFNVQMDIPNIFNLENLQLWNWIQIGFIVLVLILVFLLKNAVASGIVNLFSKLLKPDYIKQLEPSKPKLRRTVGWIVFALAGIILWPVTPTLNAAFDGFVTRVFNSILIIAISYALIVVADVIMRRAIEINIAEHKNKETSDNRTALQYVGVIIKTLIGIFGALIFLEQWMVNVKSLLAGLGIGGIAVALAAQDTAANLVAGLAIMLDKPFDIGDWIETDSGSAYVAGNVEHIGLRSCRVRADDGTLLTIPNSVIGQNTIINGTRRETRLAEINLPLALDTPVEKLNVLRNRVNEILQEQVDKNLIGEVHVNLIDIQRGAYIYYIRYTTNSDYIAHLETKDFINKKIVEVLEELEISVSTGISINA